MRPNSGNKLLVIAIVLLCARFAVAQELKSPESIVWDIQYSRFLISNTMDAYIRSVDTHGNVSDFGTTAKGSHGLLLKDNVLFACYRDEIRCYDLETEALIESYKVKGAKFLNGLCEDEKGFLYATDFSTRQIFRLQLDNSTRLIESAQSWLEFSAIPNGIAYDDLRDELVVVTWGSKGIIYCIDRQSASIKHEVESGYGNLESILIDLNGDAYVSCWTPSAILKYEQGVRTSPTLWRSEDIFRPTGLTFGLNNEILFVSADSDEISGRSSGSMIVNDISLEAFPNPVSVNSLISYSIYETGYVNISVYDCRGNMVQILVTEEKSAGTHQFMYERDERSSGLYFINIQSEGESQAIAVTLVD